MKTNDRVMVYATLSGTPAESKGIISNVRNDGMLQVLLDPIGGKARRYIWAHPKQCRRLRQRHRLFVRKTDLGKQTVAAVTHPTLEDGFGLWTEFVEVRKK